MSFQSNLGGIRAWGRKLVLPVDQIKRLLREDIFNRHCVDKVIDFGAGTLYWSGWLQEIVGAGNVYPVDIIFKETESKAKNSLRRFSIIQDVPYKQESKGPILFFACDVLHHLSEGDWSGIEQLIYQDCDFVAIKDINCRFRFKNFMNKMHDRLINGEKIRDIDPEILMAGLQKHDYQCLYYDIHKLWYPHFILIAARERNGAGKPPKARPARANGVSAKIGKGAAK